MSKNDFFALYFFCVWACQILCSVVFIILTSCPCSASLVINKYFGMPHFLHWIKQIRPYESLKKNILYILNKGSLWFLWFIFFVRTYLRISGNGSHAQQACITLWQHGEGTQKAFLLTKLTYNFKVDFAKQIKWIENFFFSSFITIPLHHKMDQNFQ